MENAAGDTDKVGDGLTQLLDKPLPGNGRSSEFGLAASASRNNLIHSSNPRWFSDSRYALGLSAEIVL